jgi:hypothetical protein
MKTLFFRSWIGAEILLVVVPLICFVSPLWKLVPGDSSGMGLILYAGIPSQFLPDSMFLHTHVAQLPRGVSGWTALAAFWSMVSLALALIICLIPWLLTPLRHRLKRRLVVLDVRQSHTQE